MASAKFAKRSVFRYSLSSYLTLAVWLAGPPLFLWSPGTQLLRLRLQAREEQSLTVLPSDASAPVFALHPVAHFAQIKPHLAMAQLVVRATALHVVVYRALTTANKLSHFALSTEY